MSAEKVFIIGSTGKIGQKAVNDLLDNKIPVTLYARSSEKVASLFSSDLVSVIQGDYTDLSPVKEGIKGHTRLLLLVADFSDFVNVKKTVATYAYEAGVKQVVDISSFSVNMGWRSSVIGSHHYYGEKAVFDIPNRGYFVALRPGRFMSNHFGMARPIADKGLYDSCEPNRVQGWISPNDIGAVAAVILRENVEKHADAVYNLTGDMVTSAERAAIFSRITGQDIKYIQVSAVQKYNKIMESGHFPHLFAIDLVDNLDSNDDSRVTPSIEILLGRKPETLEEYLSANKDKIQ
ncbi:nucleoside-diphosphate sugar epimerase [Mucor ambiguus]|uniref:Nucleoside-diphosphate sugar epimerase n=1 Tax=Mucor ambiguus TaxID=91626 RepID=A0A0C9MZM2_9FUNG|nr:nucleoside-diphosphate sugar epimerase [Mucor ambiguus]